MNEFINNFFLWRDAIIVAAASGIICGFLGVYVVLRRIVFVSAALTQVSALGVVLAFYLQSLLLVSFIDFINPFLFSVLITVLVGLFFSLDKGFYPISMEGVIGFVFLVSSSLIILLSDKITVGKHELNNILFGSAVVVESVDMFIIPFLSLSVLILNVILFKDFVFVSYDPETAKLYKYPTRFINFLFFAVLAIVLAMTTRALGALTVFSLLVLPALSAHYLSRNLKTIFTFSSIIGLLSAILGYFFSFLFSLPTGATIAFTACLILILSFIVYRIKKI